MPFPLNLLGPRAAQPPRLPSPGPDDYDSSSSTDSASTAKFHAHPSHSPRAVNHHELSQHPQSHHFGSRAGHRTSFVASTSSSLLQPSSSSFVGSSEYLLHPQSHAHSHPLSQGDASGSGRLSVSSTATSTPIPSRSASPLPQFYSSASAPSSTYTSDADSEPTSPLLARNRKNRWWNDDGRRWWLTARDGRRRRRRREGCFSLRTLKRAIRVILRHPLFPTQPTSILLTLLVLTIFAILLTLLLIHVLNPDKEPLPWRAYCSIPSVSTAPPSLSATSFSPSFPFNSLTPSDVSSLSSVMPPPFPPAHLDEYTPAGIFLGVFTMDSALERRMLIRNFWASHERSRNGAGTGDDGVGTSRTVVRFILGKPTSTWEKRIQLETETFKDMIVLPISENMNYGKTHAFFTWASTEAWVPPLPANSTRHSPPAFSYSNMTNPKVVPLAKHDPYASQQEWHMTGRQAPWVRPDFVVKVDDDSFVMLAELEARLRVELHTRTRNAREDGALHTRNPDENDDDPKRSSPSSASELVTVTALDATTLTDAPVQARASGMRQVHAVRPVSAPTVFDDPLVYWGYLVKNRFMAGELYALSWSLVEWAATDPTVKGMTKGKEDQQVAKWMRIHPRAPEIRWKSERCWIYDHPRAGTVYSHGFLFPSEVTRVRKSILSYLSSPVDLLGDSAPTVATPIGDSSPSSWAYSSVSTFKVRYSPPLPELNTLQSVEALVEGSAMSKLRDSGSGGGDAGRAVEAAEGAWMAREGRRRRYEDRRVGGTVVVHFIKYNTWFLETALALLEGEELTQREMDERAQHYVQRALELAANPNTTEPITRTIAAMHRRR